MKPKLILCLALVLSGGFLGCSDIASRADKTAANTQVKIKFNSSLSNVTITLVVAGSSGEDGTKSKTEQIKCKLVEGEFVPHLNSGAAPHEYFSMLEVHDSYAKKFYFIDAAHDFYISDNSGMKGYTFGSGFLIWSANYFEYPDSDYDAKTAIAQFENDFERSFDYKRLNQEWEKRATNVIGFNNAFPKGYVLDDPSPHIKGVGVMDGVMQLDVMNPMLDANGKAGTEILANIWIDLKSKKAIKSLVDGEEMNLSHTNDEAFAVPLKVHPSPLQILKSKAGAGDADAMFQLGSFYEQGDFDVPADLTEARRWYQKAAALGNARAMTVLGNMSIVKMWAAEPNGGINPNTGLSANLPPPTNSPDYIEGVKWLQQAAKAGDTNAANQLKDLGNP
jgi:Sel1 repeat